MPGKSNQHAGYRKLKLLANKFIVSKSGTEIHELLKNEKLQTWKVSSGNFLA